jgi:hypothetical protein
VAEPRDWGRVVTYLAGVALLLLIAQYFLGLWTNVYAPAQFASFDSGANYSPSLNVHIVNGDVLFLLSIVALVFTALARQLRLIVSAVVLVVSIYVAGQFGMVYVNSTPNDPIDSFGMGAMFLIALFSATSLLMMSWRRRPVVRSKPEMPATGAQVS